MLRWFGRWLGLGAPTSARGLREQTLDSEPDQRRQAAEQLGGINEPWACDELLRLLTDMIPEVRDAARTSLRRQGDAAVGVLVKALEHADPKIAVPAADMLGELKHPDAIRPLMLVLKFGAMDVRAAAIRTLIRYGSVAVPALTLAAQDPDPWTRTQSESILADIRAAEAATPPLLVDPATLPTRP